MSTTKQVILDAYRMIHAIDVNDTGVSPGEEAVALRRLNSMIDGWAADGLNVKEQTIAGDLVVATATVKNMASTAKLAVGLNVSGTGVADETRILTIDSATQITLDTNATATGTTVDLTFSAIPFEAAFEEGVAALLALRLATVIGEDDIPAMTVELAKQGWQRLCGRFLVTPTQTFDIALRATASQRTLETISQDGSISS
jgi:hypothetical protein